MSNEKKLDEFKQSPHKRAFLMHTNGKRAIDEDKRTVELAFSSDEPYRRWFGNEILGHKDGEVNLDRIDDGTAAVLVNHDWNDHVGVVEKVSIDDDSRGRAVVRFGSSQRSQEIFQDIVEGIRSQVSVGYMVNEMKLVEEKDDGENTYRVTDWTPFEISVVSVAADTSVGVGREMDQPEDDPPTPTIQKHKEPEMDPEDKNVDPQIDVNAERAAAAQAERERISEISAAGDAYEARDIAQEIIKSGGTIHDFNQRVLERGGFKATKAEDPEIGLNEEESQDYSFMRVLNALANPTDKRAQEAAAFELECSAAAEKQLGREANHQDGKAVIVPHEVLSRDQTVGTPTEGGHLVATDLLSGSFIDKLENAMALTQCGITTLSGLNGNIAIPRQTGGATIYWVAENGTLTESQSAFDQVAMTPKTAGAYTEISRLLLQQSSIPMEAFVRNELIKRLALGLDSAGLTADGTGNTPTGLLNITGIGDVAGGTNGLAPSHDHVVDLETDVAVANADVGSLCYLTNAKVRGTLKKTFVDSGSNAERVWDIRTPDTPLNGYRTVVSNQVPDDLDKGTSTGVCSAIVYGNFADFIMGLWGGTDLQVNPYSLDTSGAVRVTIFQSVDFNARQPASFSAMQDALTA